MRILLAYLSIWSSITRQKVVVAEYACKGDGKILKLCNSNYPKYISTHPSCHLKFECVAIVAAFADILEKPALMLFSDYNMGSHALIVYFALSQKQHP
jgi:hypothetical protein